MYTITPTQISQNMVRLPVLISWPHSILFAAKHVSKIPSDVVLNWSTFPTTAPVTETSNLKEIASRRQLANVPLQAGPDDMQLSMPQIRRGIVYTNPVRERRFHQSIIPAGTGRTAKMVAYSRMFGPYEDTFEMDAGLHFNNGLPRFKKKGKRDRAKAKVSSRLSPKPRTKQPRFRDRSKASRVSPKPRMSPRDRSKAQVSSLRTTNVSPKPRTKQPSPRDRSKAKVSSLHTTNVSPKPRTKQPSPRDRSKAQVSSPRDRPRAISQAASVSPTMKQPRFRDRSKVQVSTLPISQAASVSPKMKQPRFKVSSSVSPKPRTKQPSPRDRSKAQVSTPQAASVSPKMKQPSPWDKSKVQVSTLPISQAAKMKHCLVSSSLHTTSVSPGSRIPSSASPEQKPRVCLKNFSIPLVPINIHFVRVSVSSSTGISPSPPPESLSSDETVFSNQCDTSLSSNASSVSSNSSTLSIPYIVVDWIIYD